jgi:hypothetical protein
MKKRCIVFLAACLLVSVASPAQRLKEKDIPAAVRSALEKKYPTAAAVTWEKEKGNYEANWGGRSGEDNSVQFSPSGDFIEMVKAIPVSELPSAVAAYVKEHYKGAKITEAGKVTDAAGRLSYEAEVHGKDLVFDEQGRFVKKED